MENYFAHHERRERQPAPADRVGFSAKIQQSPLLETHHNEKGHDFRQMWMQTWKTLPIMCLSKNILETYN